MNFVVHLERYWMYIELDLVYCIIIITHTENNVLCNAYVQSYSNS